MTQQRLCDQLSPREEAVTRLAPRSTSLPAVPCSVTTDVSEVRRATSHPPRPGGTSRLFTWITVVRRHGQQRRWAGSPGVRTSAETHGTCGNRVYIAASHITKRKYTTRRLVGLDSSAADVKFKKKLPKILNSEFRKSVPQVYAYWHTDHAFGIT